MRVIKARRGSGRINARLAATATQPTSDGGATSDGSAGSRALSAGNHD